MDKGSIKAVIKQAGRAFTPRKEASRNDTQLQLLRKCETELFGVLKSGNRMYV
jgi:hypothetical protein